MLDRLVGLCFTLLVVAVALTVAVHLIEAVWPALVMIIATIGGLVILGFVMRLLWSRHRTNRW